MPDWITEAGGPERVVDLVKRVVASFRRFKVKSQLFSSEADPVGPSPAGPIDNRWLENDVAGFLYSLYDPSFRECLQSLLLDGANVRVAFIKSFLRGRSANELKYSAMRVEIENALVELGCK